MVLKKKNYTTIQACYNELLVIKNPAIIYIIYRLHKFDNEIFHIEFFNKSSLIKNKTYSQKTYITKY